MTEVELELLDNAEMYSFFENYIRGGISQVSNRYSKANNKYLKDFDKNKPIVYLMYWDMNNLYGYSMSKKLPVNKFKWVQNKSTGFKRLSQKDEILQLDDEADKGYVYQIPSTFA